MAAVVDQLDRWVSQQLVDVVDPRGVRPASPNLLRHGGIGVLGTDPDEGATRRQEAGDLSEDVGVVQADCGEPNGLLQGWRS